MVELTTVSEAIGKFVETLIEKFKRGEKHSSEDYLFLTLYYLSREIKENKEEVKEYIDRRIDDLKAYVDKGFENTNKRIDDLKSDIKEIKSDIRTVIEILTKK